jgi:hypothetical protein
MALGHVQPQDDYAAREIGSLIAALEAVDREMETRGITKAGVARMKLLEHKARLSRELRAWLREMGATPKSRFDFAARLSQGSVVDQLRRRIGEL